jgi:putative hemolysin
MSNPTLQSAAPAASSQLRPSYRLRLATTPADVASAQALRFEVFNLELDEGLVQSYDTGLDVDAFDAVCDHLIVEDAQEGVVVGTYRLQTGLRALQGLGYYSEREFDFAPFEPERARLVELGRACIHQQHRNFAVLNLLWKGIGTYARERGARFLIGCSSITSQDPAVGAAAFERLRSHLAPLPWQTKPLPAMACSLEAVAAEPPRIPRLLSAYLAMGAAICGEPAIDREFRTIDFLTWVDVEAPTVAAMQARGRFVV